ncbi:hypothetical protein [Nocardia miyunensis]|uniref:hypothetical protein n=1 Tax=Nocardia miyunensis TaxID=282684 RepID=UPI0012F5181F|nr:hypothetical protein [Nocardia miyunensis]
MPDQAVGQGFSCRVWSTATGGTPEVRVLMRADDEATDVEIHVIQDVIEAVDVALRRSERCGRRLIVPRSRVYAVVLQSVIADARGHHHRATLDCADVLDVILEDDVPSPHVGNPVIDAVATYTTCVN